MCVPAPKGIPAKQPPPTLFRHPLAVWLGPFISLSQLCMCALAVFSDEFMGPQLLPTISPTQTVYPNFLLHWLTLSILFIFRTITLFSPVVFFSRLSASIVNIHFFASLSNYFGQVSFSSSIHTLFHLPYLCLSICSLDQMNKFVAKHDEHV